jgi:hypothetical protein
VRLVLTGSSAALRAATLPALRPSSLRCGRPPLRSLAALALAATGQTDPQLRRYGSHMTATVNRYSAAGSALGYIAQVQYGLLLMLRRMDDDSDVSLSLETLDDIVFERDVQTSAVELWQTKHHLPSASLGDASTDLWKSLHNWITEDSGDLIVRVLMTTARASSNSAAYCLSSNPTLRNTAQASKLLAKVADAAGNKANAKYYAAYLALSETRRLAILDTISIADGALQAAHIRSGLLSSLRKATTAARREPLVDRLWGWWAGRTLTHLTRVANGIADSIHMAEVEAQLHMISQSLRDDNLPLDYGDTKEPTVEQAAADERVFVEQLRLISWHSRRIQQAILDHNRAFLQRSRWERDQLIHSSELITYDRRLIEEWRRHFLPTSAEETEQDLDDDAARTTAQAALLRLETSDLPEMRPGMASGYIPNGSLHLLADRLQVGWHPRWIELLSHRAAEAGPDGVEEVAS